MINGKCRIVIDDLSPLLVFFTNNNKMWVYLSVKTQYFEINAIHICW